MATDEATPAAASAAERHSDAGPARHPNGARAGAEGATDVQTRGATSPVARGQRPPGAPASVASTRAVRRPVGADAAAPRVPATARSLTNAGAAFPAPPSSGNDAIALVQSASLPSLVQRELTRQILAGELSAGTKLNEVDVAASLRVSRGPVREAFRALEESGLVRFEKNRGVFVRQVSLEEADEIFELRALLDGFAGRRAAKNAKPQDIAALRHIVDDMGLAAARGDIDGYFALNLEFHDRIVALAGNAKLAQLYRRLVNELNLYRRASLGRAGNLPVSVAEHRAIVERIAARQPAAAARLLHDHVLGSRERAHVASESCVPAHGTRSRR